MAKKPGRKPGRLLVSRRDSPEAREKFLDALAEGLTADKAADRIGVNVRTIYAWREKDIEFDAAWARAYKLGTDTLESEARRRAFEGTLKPVFHQGVECGYVREYSDTLLIFLMKSRDPHRFCDRTRAAAIERAVLADVSKDDNSTNVSDRAIAALERIAAEKAAYARKAA